MRRRAILTLFLSLVAHRARAGESVDLTLKNAQKIDKEAAARYGKDWELIAPWAYVCPVNAPDTGAPALAVITVLVLAVYKDGFFKKHSDFNIPDPIIVDLNGEILGNLPENFPDDPPGKLSVSFADWRVTRKGSFPFAIYLYEAGKSALEPHPLPFYLSFDPDKGRFFERSLSA